MGLLDIIKDRIRSQGPLPFATFMEMALYYPGLGYYTSGQERIGEKGDFYTSPATHPAFGALLCLQLEEMWRRLGEPGPFWVVEVGAGRGQLRQDILDFAAHFPAFSRALSHLALEKGPGPGLWGGGARLDGVVGCFLSNELWDAFPVHRLRREAGRLQEVHVALEGDRLVEVWREPSAPELEDEAREGRGEVCLEVGRWLGEVASALERGYVLTVDYGHVSTNAQDSLVAYRRHSLQRDPYARPGEQDLTCHVDFGAAVRAGERAGLACLGLTSQRQFLLNLGLEAFLEELSRRALSPGDYYANRLSLLELVRPEGFGSFLVLLQGKGAPPSPLAGFTPQTSQPKLPPMPLLAPGRIPLLEGKYPHQAWGG